MRNVLMDILGWIYNRIPIRIRPWTKRIAYWILIRFQSIVYLCRYHKRKQIQFVDFEIAELTEVEFLGARNNEVLIDVFYSLVSPGTETAVLMGLPGARRQFLYNPGYSASGRVVGVGKKVKGIKIGDYVAGRIPHCGKACAHAGTLFRVPDGVSPSDACFIELGIIVLQGIRKARIRPGDKVAVIGQGLIGQLANRLARVMGGSPVIAVAPTRNREKTALSSGGADQYIPFRENKASLEQIQADVVIEAVGVPDAVLTAMGCAREGGKVVLLGSARGLGRGVDLFSLAQMRNIEIIGAHISAMPEVECSIGRWTYREEGKLFLQLLQERRLEIGELVTWRAKPEECNHVYEVLARGGGGHVGVVFEWNSESLVKEVN